MNLAIKGHSTRGKEVIKILEMLGGENEYKLNGCNIECAYYNKNGVIHNTSPVGFNNIKLLALEEFLEKYPYKVGDKVIVTGLPEYPKNIVFMEWFDDNIYYSFDNETWFLPSELILYNDEVSKKSFGNV